MNGDAMMRAVGAESAILAESNGYDYAEPASARAWTDMKVGILTGGGDCPGLNAVIRGFVLGMAQEGHQVVGLRNGWLGLIEQRVVPLSVADVEGIERRGGTILKTSRTNPYKDAKSKEQAFESFKALGLDAIVAVGGDDTLGACNRLNQDGIPAVGVPKTIDNDLSGTDYTFGFDTAVNIVMEALDRIHTTADSHERILVVEVMGRHAGWMTLHGGLAGGAHAILLPEEPFDLDALAAKCTKRQAEGHDYTLIACSEGALATNGEGFATQDQSVDEFGNVRLGGIGEALAKALEAKTGQQSRHVVLGHLQRGGRPTAMDTVMSLRLGLRAAKAVADGEFGTMVSWQGTEVGLFPLADGVKELKTVPEHRVAEKNVLTPVGAPKN